MVARCHPYKTPRELFHEKRGELPDEDISDQQAVYWGNLLEGVVAAEYERRIGNKVRRVNKALSHPDLSFVIGHIDRDVQKTDRALECKTAGEFMRDAWGPDGSDQVPEYYLIQCQHYMALLPKTNVFDLAVLIGGRDFRIYDIPRDNILIDALLKLETHFWLNHVEAGNPPDLDFDHPSTLDLLAKVYPGTDGQVITLPEESIFRHRTLEEARAKVREYQGVVDGAKARLKALCGSAAVGLIPGMNGAGYTRKLVQRKPYTAEPQPYIDFRFSKSPKGAKQ